MPETPDKAAVVLPPSEEENKQFSNAERRGEKRYPFMAEAEVTDLQSQVRVAGRCSDLSPSGCYVDTLTPLAPGAEVRIRLARDECAFEATALVSYAQIPLGVGLKFTEIARDEQAVLDSWISELSGGRASAEAKPAAAPQAAPSESGTTLLLVLNELITLLVRKKILTETEATAFRRKMFG